MTASDGGLRALFRKYLPAVHWTTVESRFTEGGIPDLNGCCVGTEFWIECKLTTGWRIRLRPSQIGWITRRIRCGGNVFIAVRRKRKGCDEFYLYYGNDVIALRDEGMLGVTPLASGSSGPAHWPWQAAGAGLLGLGGAAPRRGLAPAVGATPAPKPPKRHRRAVAGQA